MEDVSSDQDGLLCELVRVKLEAYFKKLDGEQPSHVYQLVLGEVERPMLEIVMKYARNNQTVASRILGIHRDTLRKKLGTYGLK